MLHKNKQKFPFWVYPETLDRIGKTYRHDNCQSQSEFIEKAVEFYLGYIESNRNTKFLAIAVKETVESVMEKLEKRISSLQFKNAVAQLEVAKTLALFVELDDEQKRQIHTEAVSEAKQL